MWWQNRLAILVLILGLAIFGNLIFLDYKILSQKATQDYIIRPAEVKVAPVPIATTSAESSTDFQALIDTKIGQLREELLKTLQTPTPKPAVKTAPPPQAPPGPKELYINFGNSGSTTATSWTDVSGTDITFDAANYPGVKAFYFQANLKSDAPDRQTFSRIYDATHSVGVQGSEMNYAGLTSKLTESGSLTFLSGRLTLRVQIHSLNGNLATNESPRIRVVYQ